MKVYYPGPGQKTYHPQLGKLIAGEEFELEDKEAKKYIEGGLLKEVKVKTESKKAEGSKPKAETKNNKPL